MSVKLTDRQQVVVNLMAAGDVTLRYSPAFGRGLPASAALHGASGRHHTVAANVPEQLLAKGVVQQIESAWERSDYTLTTLGKSLARPIGKPKLIKWWRVGYTGIESSEFVDETADYLIRGDGRNVKKVGGYERWFPTREEAVKSRMKELEQSVKSAKSRLRDAERELAKFRKTEGV
jgi:hypothetical protein